MVDSISAGKCKRAQEGDSSRESGRTSSSPSEAGVSRVELNFFPRPPQRPASPLLLLFRMGTAEDVHAQELRSLQAQHLDELKRGAEVGKPESESTLLLRLKRKVKVAVKQGLPAVEKAIIGGYPFVSSNADLDQLQQSTFIAILRSLLKERRAGQRRSSF